MVRGKMHAFGVCIICNGREFREDVLHLSSSEGAAPGWRGAM